MTGIETWDVSLLEIGPLYPLPGSEVLWVVLAVAWWLYWHWMQARRENRTLADPGRPQRPTRAVR